MAVPVLHEFIHEIVVSAILAIAGSVAMWPIKRIQKAYVETIGKLETVHAELVSQRTNHLTHIEASNEKQVEILGKVADTLGAIHLDQSRLLGRLER